MKLTEEARERLGKAQRSGFTKLTEAEAIELILDQEIFTLQDSRNYLQMDCDDIDWSYE